MPTVMLRTECNQRSKYFVDTAQAFRHFYKCIAERKDVEIWLMTVTGKQGKRLIATQELLDCVYFQ